MSNEPKAETVMGVDHKETIQTCRDTLVENMIPDDLFNHLIANKILTQSDVGRIKERSTREAMNEELLNNLVLRSDRAYTVFVTSLRKTLQGYLADILHTSLDAKINSNSAKAQATKRPTEIQDSSTSQAPKVPRQSPPPSQTLCKCQQISNEMSAMFKSAFDNISRHDDSPEAFHQFRHELTQTNILMKESLEVMNSLKMICNHGSSADDTAVTLVTLPDTQQKTEASSPTNQPRMHPSQSTPDINTEPTPTSPDICRSCEQISQIKTILNDALRDIDSPTESGLDFEDYQTQLTQRNAMIKDTLEVMQALKTLCRHESVDHS